MINKKARTIDLRSNSNKEFFLIHGYTGSPTDLNQLPYILHKKFNANVKVIRMHGHGTRINDLDNLKLDDFITQIDQELKKDIKSEKEIIIGGVSFGAQMALAFAAKYKFKGVICISAPYKLKFPLNLPGIGLIRFFLKDFKYMSKKRKKAEKELRKNSFSYDYTHANGIVILKEINKIIKKNAHNITAPILVLHSTSDPVGSYKSALAIKDEVNSKNKRVKLFTNGPHNMFYSSNFEKVSQEVINFVKENKLFKNK